MFISPTNTFTMIVDIQERLLPHMHDNEELIGNISILLQGLNLLEIPYILNEQYPKGLGPTVPEVLTHLNGAKPYEKITFSCCAEEKTSTDIIKMKKNSAIVCGIETHVCVMQTCLDLLSNNITPILVTDCVSSRKYKDHDVAIARLAGAGVVLATYESLLFELCRSAKNPVFKEISALVK